MERSEPMKELLQEIKTEINSLAIEDINSDRLTFESQIVITADIRQFLYKLKKLKTL